MSNRKWSLGLVFLVLIFGYVLIRFFAASTRVDDLVQRIGRGQDVSTSAKHVVLIAQELDNPFWREMEQGAVEAAAKQGMKIDYMGPIRIDAAEQTKLLEKAVAAQPDAILVQGIHDAKYDQWIDKAVERGIPVLTVDADEADSRRLAYVGTDNLEAGKQLGRFLVKDAAEGAVIGVIIGSELADNQRLRLEGFRSVISTAPNFRIIDVRSSNISRVGAAKQAEAMLKEHAGMNVIVGFSALDAPGIVEGMQAAGRKNVRVYGFDDLEATRKGIAEGRIRATVVQQPAEIGSEAVAQLSRLFKGEKLPRQRYIPTAIWDAEALKSGGEG